MLLLISFVGAHLCTCVLRGSDCGVGEELANWR